jgi:SNF2 family DNA or RNA helicase
VETIRSFPSRFWDKDNKEWELPFNKLGELTEKLSDYDFDIYGDYVTVEKPKAEMPKGFEFKTQPFQHQIDGFNYGLQHDRWLLADQMGLGKSKQVIDIAVAKKLQKGYKHCLIICGVNGLKWNWQNEVSTHSNETGWVLGQRSKGGRWNVGSNKDKLYDLENIKSIKSYFLITNIESLRSEDIVNKIVELCKSADIGLVALDECHKAKDPSSIQGKGLLKVQPECRIAMTGTPLMNSPMDLYIILKWLGYEKHAFYAFKKHYCVMGGFGGYQVVGYKNLDELQEQLNEIMLRRLQKDVLDLPEKTYIDEYVEMTGKQEQVYKEITATIKANIDMIEKAVNPLSELIRMRQATGYTGILSSTIKESAKLDRMVEITDEAIANGQKVVVFSNWTQVTLPAYNELAKKYHGTYITGEVDSEQRQQAVERFQNDNDCKFVVGSIGAAGTGITLTAGTVVIFLDEPWTMAAKCQAEDRCHRIGTTENVTIYTIMCKNTIDERVHELVEKKGQMSDALIDGKIVGNKTEILNFLLS